MFIITNNSEEYPVPSSAMDTTSDEVEPYGTIVNSDSNLSTTDDEKSYIDGLEIIEDTEDKIDNIFGQTNPPQNSSSATVDGRLSNNLSNKNDDLEDYKTEISYNDLEDYIATISDKDFIHFLRNFAIVKMPEIEFQMVLDFSELENSKLTSLLTIGCISLINKLKELRDYNFNQSVYTNYQIELRPIIENSSCYQLFLRTDCNEWYELERNNDKNIESKLMAYIKRVISKNIKNRTSSNESSNRSNANFRPKQLACSKPTVCEKGKECGFYVCPTHCIYKEEGAYYAAARCSGYPIVTVNPKQHYSNEEWVRNPDAWKIICHVIDNLKNDLQLKSLPFERIYFNFGEWQSSNTGHAHGNMILSKEAINSCQNAPGTLGILQYSTKCPVDHRLDDAEELYATRLDENIHDENIHDENSLNQGMDSDDGLDEEPNSFDTYCSFSRPVSSCSDRCLTYKLYAKSSIIRQLIQQRCEKANHVFLDAHI